MRVYTYIVHLDRELLFHTQYDQSRLVLNLISLDSFQKNKILQFITRIDKKETLAS